MQGNFATGRLTKDPELTYVNVNGGQSAICKFSMAVVRPNTKDVTDFFDCECWGTRGEAIAKCFKKGSGIAVSGYTITGSYKNKDGNNVRTWTWRVTDWSFTDKKGNYDAGSEKLAEAGFQQAFDDMPF